MAGRMNHNNKTILLVIARFEFGGVAMQAFLWARFLRENNFRPVIAGVTVKDDRYCEMLKAHHLEYVVLKLHPKRSGIISSIRYLVSLVREIRSLRPYAIFPFNKVLSYNINLVRSFTGADKCYAMERNDGSEEPTTAVGEWTRRLSLRNADALLSNSQAAADRSIHTGKKIVIKNSFINPRNDVSETPPYRLPDDKLILLHIANLTVIKNYDLLLDGWPDLVKRFPNACLVVIGAETVKKNDVILQKMNQPGVIYLHRQPKVSYFIKRADICLLSSFNEGCSNTMLEYMYYEKLICASDIPALKEMVAQESYPFLFDNSSKQDFVTKVGNAIALDRESARKITDANKIKLENEYSDKNYHKIIELLSKP